MNYETVPVTLTGDPAPNFIWCLKNTRLDQSLFKHLFHYAHQLGGILIGRSRLLLLYGFYAWAACNGRNSKEQLPSRELRPSLNATSHSTIFGIPMRPLREDQKHRHRFTR